MDTLLEKYINCEITMEELTEKFMMVNDNNEYELFGLSDAEIELTKKLGIEALDDIIEARKQKKVIIEKWKLFFKNEIAENHRKNTLKLSKLKQFNLNPFLDLYKANFLLGNSTPLSIATTLVYARALGTSINTTFGTSLQKFCSNILSGYASTTSGIDIEFIDFCDGRKKYCQIKAGPNTINKDDVKTISDHFSSVRNLARTNHLDIRLDDLIVGVFYGEKNDLSTHYKKIMRDYPVYIGEDFWYRLTGDQYFYQNLSKASNEVASEYDGRDLLDNVITKLAQEIEDSYLSSIS